MPNQTSAIMIDRLETALARKGVTLKRQALLEVAAYALGFRNDNVFSAAARKGELDPPVARISSMPASSAVLLEDEEGSVIGAIPTDTPASPKRADQFFSFYDGRLFRFPDLMPSSTLPASENHQEARQTLTAILEQIDAEIENRKHGGDPSQWAELQEVYEKGKTLLDSYSQKTTTPASMSLPLRYSGSTIRDARDHAICDMIYGTDEERAANAQAIIAAFMPGPEASHEPATCERCDTPLAENGLCQDETCPFSDHVQKDPTGWTGHPEARRFVEHAKLIKKPATHDLHGPMGILWLTDVCGDDAYGVEADDLHRHNLSYEVIDGSFSPLSKREKEVLHSHTILNASTKFPARVGASALSDGKKYLCPVIEFKFDDHPTEQAAREAASAYAKSIKDQVERIGGIVFIDDEMESDRCDVCVFVPMDILIDATSSDRIRALSYLLLPKEERDSTPSMICDFLAQAWLNDNPISVDPNGDTSWDATFDVLLNRAEIESVIDNGDIPIEILHLSPTAPEWIRKWTGPCDLYYDEDIMEELIRE